MEPQPEEEVSSRRIWAAVIVATVLTVISYGFLLLAIFAPRLEVAEGEVAASADPAWALGFILVPFVFISLAFISKRERAPIATLKAMGLWVMVALPLGLFNPITGLAAGFGTGGIVALRRGEFYRLSYRVWAVVITTAYVTGLLFFAPPGGVFAGAVLPIPAIAIADNLAARWAAVSKEEDES